MNIEEFKNKVIPLSQKLYRLAERMLKDIDEAEDMVQEVMIGLWSSRNKVGKIFNIDAYALRIMKNRCLDHLKSYRIKNVSNDFNAEEIREEFGDFQDQKEMVSILSDTTAASSGFISESRTFSTIRNDVGILKNLCIVSSDSV